MCFKDDFQSMLRILKSLFAFLTQRLHKQSKGFSGGADYADDMHIYVLPPSVHFFWSNSADQ